MLRARDRGEEGWVHYSGGDRCLFRNAEGEKHLRALTSVGALLGLSKKHPQEIPGTQTPCPKRKSPFGNRESLTPG